MEVIDLAAATVSAIHFYEVTIMRRANLGLGFTSSVISVALVSLAYGIDSHRSSATAVEPKRGEAKQAQQTLPIDTKLNESIAVVPLRSSDGNQEQPETNKDQAGIIVAYSRDGGIADESTTREIMREDATKDIRGVYGFLFEDLDLTPQEREILFALLIEDWIASTPTPYKRGETIDKEEQSRKIAAIIGDRKLEQFRELESNLGAYTEVQKIASLLQKNGVPLTDPQRGGLLKVVIGTLDRYQATPPPGDVEPGSIESLEHQLTQVAEYERHFMELVPSVLSARQVVYLDEKYQYLSYWRADAIERQRQARADGTRAENSPLSFPLWVGD
jgi:hypothetical protein